MWEEHEDEEGNVTRIMEENNNIKIFEDEHDQKGTYLQLTENILKNLLKSNYSSVSSSILIYLKN